MPDIFEAIFDNRFEEVKRIVAKDSENVNIPNIEKRNPLDHAIACGKLEIAKFLFEKGGRPNLEAYFDGVFTPVHRVAFWGNVFILKWVFEENILPLSVLNGKDTFGRTPMDQAIAYGELEMAKYLWENGGRPNLNAYCDRGGDSPLHYAACCGETATLKWVFKNKVLPLRALNIKDSDGKTPLDVAITHGKLEIAKCLWEIGGQPNLEIYCGGKNTPVHEAARREYTTNTLKWVFTKKILPLHMLQIKDEEKMTPLDIANRETAALLQRLLFNSVFLAMQRAKRDHHQMCVLRRLPDELLDIVIDEVAARIHLEVVW